MSSFDTAASWIAGGFKDAAEKKRGEKKEDIKARLKKKQADIETRLLNGLGLGEAPKRKDEPKGKDAEVLVWNGIFAYQKAEAELQYRVRAKTTEEKPFPFEINETAADGSVTARVRKSAYLQLDDVLDQAKKVPLPHPIVSKKKKKAAEPTEAGTHPGSREPAPPSRAELQSMSTRSGTVGVDL